MAPNHGAAAFLAANVRAPAAPAHDLVMEIIERAACPPADAAESAIAVARALARLPAADWLRLNALARLWARGLPDGFGWSDLLHEALLRALDGSRQWPAGVAFPKFLSGVMRSLRADFWRRQRREADVILRPEDAPDPAAAVCPAGSQERVLAAVQAMAEIHRLFADDQTALRIIAGLGNGLSAVEIRQANGLSDVQYDSARRRMRRALLRAGLADDRA